MASYGDKAHDREAYYAEMHRRAVEIATEAHKEQKRWGGEPYITHPIAVAEAFGLKTHPRLKITAILHDVLEDSDVTEDDLLQDFPVEIVDALVLMTHKPGESYADYIMRIRGVEGERGLAHNLALKVKMADLRHNLSDLNDPKKHRQRRDKYELALKLLLTSVER
jgi:(p)ppGpp synthase/HD superfamily hydrolase